MYLQWILLFSFFYHATSSCTKYLPGGKAVDYPLIQKGAAYDAGLLAALFKVSKITLPTLPSAVAEVATSAASFATPKLKEAFPHGSALAASLAVFSNEPVSELTSEELEDEFFMHIFRIIEEPNDRFTDMKDYVDRETLDIIKQRVNSELIHMFTLYSSCITEETITGVTKCLHDASEYIRSGYKKYMLFTDEIKKFKLSSPPTVSQVKKMELTLLPFRLYALVDLFCRQAYINMIAEDAEKGIGDARSTYKKLIEDQKKDADMFQDYSKQLIKWMLVAKEGNELQCAEFDKAEYEREKCVPNEKKCTEKYWKSSFDVFNTVLSAAAAQPIPEFADAPKESFEEHDQKEASNQWIDLDVEIIL